MGHKFLPPHLGPQPLGRDFPGMNIRASKPLSRGKTSNAEVSEDSRCHSMFGVGCSMLDVPLGEGQGEGSWEILQTGLDRVVVVPSCTLVRASVIFGCQPGGQCYIPMN